MYQEIITEKSTTHTHLQLNSFYGHKTWKITTMIGSPLDALECMCIRKTISIKYNKFTAWYHQPEISTFIELSVKKMYPGYI